ncbi:hypothetical protein LTR56_005451 [Elasticomyces elasticus]|nr:hypothetical protein LTR22_015269 [Elasticomyces elasticus]KAK3651941.1 hypothetical protein LTR56_005451 [Elasticomyces elasticus]KAK4927836.1 hypothetical protein LTR49_005463 [Elasticomyces elasticus]KAK5750904.1 hypothetical protein LTS12_019048 [Elasticomyces elasticus]
MAVVELLGSALKREHSSSISGTSSKRPRAGTEQKYIPNDSVFGQYADAFTVRVGTPSVPFTIHTGLLARRCPAYAETLLGAQAVRKRCANQTNIPALPNESARTFWMFLVWLYTEKLIPPPVDLGKGISGVETRGGKVISRLKVKDQKTSRYAEAIWVEEDIVDIYVFGRRSHIDSLSNLALSELALHGLQLEVTASRTAVTKAFASGHWTSLLCNYLVDEATSFQGGQTLALPETLHFPETYLDRIAEAKHNNSIPAPFLPDPCRYHIHHGIGEQQLCSARLKPGRAVTIGNTVVYEHLRETGLLLADADFFKGAFSGQFAEGKNDVVELNEEHPAAFLMFVHWLYTGELSPIRPSGFKDLASHGHVGDPTVQADVDDVLLDIIRLGRLEHRCDMLYYLVLYSLADRRGVRELRNKVVDKFIQCREEGWPLPSISMIRLAYNMLPGSSKLCLFLAHEVAWFWDDKTHQNFRAVKKMSSEFLAIVLQQMIEVSRNTIGNVGPAWRVNLCDYHEHQTDVEEATCKKMYKQSQEKLSAKRNQGTFHEEIMRGHPNSA